MKRVFKNPIIMFVFCVLIFGFSTVFSYSLLAKNTGFTPKDSSWNVENVKDALDDLYDTINNLITKNAKKYAINNNHKIDLIDLFTSLNILADETKMDKIISSSEYTNIILNNSNIIKALDSSDPIVSTDTSRAFASSSYPGYPAGDAFRDSNYWSVAPGVNYDGQYLGYDFGKEVWVYKMEIYMWEGKQNSDYVLEASNDNSNYTIIKDGLHQNNSTLTIIPNNYNKKYRYYRVRYLGYGYQSGSGNTCVTYIRFYAK